MKRAHAAAIAILVAIAVSLGIATALQATAEPSGPATTSPAAPDAAATTEAQRLDAIERSLDRTSREMDAPTPDDPEAGQAIDRHDDQGHDGDHHSGDDGDDD